MGRIIPTLLLLTLFSAGPLSAQKVTFWSDMPKDELLEALLSEMTDADKLGQCFLLGYASRDMNPDIEEWIREKNLGGVKIFGWNARNLPVMVDTLAEMQKAALATPLQIPLFTATDQEGGWVRHVQGNTARTPGNMAIAATDLPYDAWYSGYYIGMELRSLGINMNFAPTVDVYVNPKANVIGPRAFSDDPLQSSILGTAYYQGMAESRVICTAKHFPGHGNADKDSHGALPQIPYTMEELWDIDLMPYRFLFKEGIPGVLVGHLAFPKITGSLEPASLSPFFCTDLIRGRMGFEGLLVTDDLAMRGARIPGFSMDQVVHRALEAGNDLAMISGDINIQNSAWEYCLRAMKKDPAFRERIEESARRILRIKLKYLKDDDRVPLIPTQEAMTAEVPHREGEKYFYQHAYRSITLLRGDSAELGIELDEEGRVKERVLLAGTFPYFFIEGFKRFPGADRFFFDYQPFHTPHPRELKENLRREAAQYDHIIFNLYSPGSLDVLKALEPFADKVTVFSVLSPVFLMETPWVPRAIAAWGLGPFSFEAGFAALRGDFTPTAEIPLSFFREFEAKRAADPDP